MSKDKNNAERRRQERYMAVSAFFEYLVKAEARRQIGWFTDRSGQPRVQIKEAGWNRPLRSSDPVVSAWVYTEFMRLLKRSPEPWELKEVSRWLDVQALAVEMHKAAMESKARESDPETAAREDETLHPQQQPDLADDDPILVALTFFLEDNNVIYQGRTVVKSFQRQAKLAYPELVDLAVTKGVSRKSLPELASGYSQRLNEYQRQGVIKEVYGLDFEAQHRHYGAVWVFLSSGEVPGRQTPKPSDGGREWLDENTGGDDDLFEIVGSPQPE